MDPQFSKAVSLALRRRGEPGPTATTTCRVVGSGPTRWLLEAESGVREELVGYNGLDVTMDNRLEVYLTVGGFP